MSEPLLAGKTDKNHESCAGQTIATITPIMTASTTIMIVILEWWVEQNWKMSKIGRNCRNKQTTSRGSKTYTMARTSGSA